LCLKDSINKLLIVIKTLWIDNAPRNDFMIDQFNETESSSYQDIHIKWEYYIQKGNKYYPLKRADTIYQLTQSILSSKEYKFRKNDLSFFKYVLKSQLEMMNFNSSEEKYEYKKGLTFYQIDSFNQKRFLLPIITEHNIKKGVFQNYNEFKNNMPGVEEYEYKKIDKVKCWVDSKNSKPLENIFLLSDDNGIHTGAEKRISVVRVGNTFEFFEGGYLGVSKSLAGNLLNLVPGSYYPYSQFQNRFHSGNGGESQGVLIPRQINMETGEVY
jgi:hypothetical protein